MSEVVSSNLPEYSVSEISGAVKRTLEGAFGRVRVRGEITEFKRYPSGHLYFSLKDENAKISGIVWKSGVSRLGLVPENGVEVIATGRITTYGERSSYQLIVERMEYAGAGALLARIERLKQRLGEEGLFGEERKRRLPMLPSVVGVVTSPSGAVLHDIRTTIARRFPRPVLLWPVPVQGDGAAARIAAAIAGFDAIRSGGPIPRPDVLIIARGGGSLEDLMAFNDEAVVRAAAACRIPLISAVGHETDHTLIDLVSDRRAPTPTAAAELAVPARIELASLLLRDGARLSQGLLRLVGEQRVRLGRAERGLPDLPALLGTARQRLDDRGERLTMALPNLLAARRAALDRAGRAVPDAPALVRAAWIAVDDRAHRLRLALPALVRERRGALDRVERAMPTAPALLAPRHQALLRIHLDAGLRHAVARHRQRASTSLARLSPAMLATGLRQARTAVDDRAHRLQLALPALVRERRGALDRVERAMPTAPTLLAPRYQALLRMQLNAGLRHAIAAQRQRASTALVRLSPVMLATGLREARRQLASSAAHLDSVSYAKVLERGFALVSDRAGHPITRAAAVPKGARLRLRFADGSVDAQAAGSAQGTLPF